MANQKGEAGSRGKKSAWQRAGSAFLQILGVLILGAAGVSGYAYQRVMGTYDTPVPNIVHSDSPQELAQGERLYVLTCSGCHSTPPGVALLEAQMRGITAYAPNITSDRQFGIGGWSDGEIARVIRYGVRRDGHLTIGMPPYHEMSDDDLASLVSFIRSDHDWFVPEHSPRPEAPELTWMQIFKLAFVVRIQPAPEVAPIHAPRKAVTAEYGKYLADALFRCWDCHSPGYGDSKRHGPQLYGGGVRFTDELGRGVYSANLTPDDSGIKGWSFVEFCRAVRDGMGHKGFVLQPPMKRFRALDNDEMEAIHLYLSAQNPVVNIIPLNEVPMSKPAAGVPPEEIFASLGCRVCHGWRPPFDRRLRAGMSQPTAQIARWIRNPQMYRPNTNMPTFADSLDESQALTLAEWLQKVAVKKED